MLRSLFFSVVRLRHLENGSVRACNLPGSEVLPASVCSFFKDFNGHVGCRASSDCIQHFHHERAFGINGAVGDLGESGRGCTGAVHQPCKNLLSKERWILIAELMLTLKQGLCPMVFKANVCKHLFLKAELHFITHTNRLLDRYLELHMALGKCYVSF